uniref:Uncharacterized protein n=1 Tax=Amphimedon queenslandica TaxID=400682 RepID=A0A1X7VB84_AMPQE
MDETTKRFRLHVIKEIHQTEHDYTSSLEFTVDHILTKMKQLSTQNPSITEEVIEKLFCNIEEILAAHKALLVDLDKEMIPSASPDAQISSCYVKHHESFQAYRAYGENNEQSQKTLYQLEDVPSLKAFFVGAMLLGGVNEASISSYLFKPIQRICKYPLLFKELLKYTPESHKDYEDTVKALGNMRILCSVINEAKRRVERLEAIAEWQETIEGWEGSPVVDTCSELVKEGSLIKISAGNMQERVFFLYDGLLVYCKRAASFSLRTKAEKTLIFKGRIPVANIEVENIEDGSADCHTYGYTVKNGWKMRNLAKNKWFVLIAKTHSEKQEWIEAVRTLKDRIRNVAAGIARDTRLLMLDKGRKLHELIHNNSKILYDHRYRLRSYPHSFSGCDFTRWLVKIGEAGDEKEGVRLGQALLENGIIHHVGDKHQFKNSPFVYIFRYDDDTFQASDDTLDILAKGLRVYVCLHSLHRSPLRDHRSGLRSIKQSISGQTLVDWLMDEKFVESRKEGVALCTHLMATGLIKHATDDQKFKDSNGIYYQFVPDAVSDQPLHTDFMPIVTFTCQTIMVPYSSEFKDYGIKFSNGPAPIKIAEVTPTGPADGLGISPGQEVLCLGGQWLSSSNDSSSCECLVEGSHDSEIPLELVVSREASEVFDLKLKDGESLGLQLKGNQPVFVNRVDKGSLSATAGLTPGCCILRINNENVITQNHDTVVSHIKKAKENKDPSISLKIGIPFTGHVTKYQYESTGDMPLEVLRQITESPYVYSIPAQLFKVYENEARTRASLLQSRKSASSKLENYVTELQIQADNYKKAHAALSSPRYPSYRPCGAHLSPFLEGCPINLHSIMMEVGSGTRNHTSSPDPEGSICSSQDGLDTNIPITKHFTHTMAYPSLMNRTHSAKDIDVLERCQSVRELLAILNGSYLDLIRDCELLQSFGVYRYTCAVIRHWSAIS